ncbi:MAG TPA: hypothetical protein VEF90_15920 [Xanthobacteraceae bacterium]|nr:hypothetical protein [Xanthobacteraceae bacterium]
MSAAATRQPNFALLVVIAWLLVALQLLLLFWPQTAVTLNDTDDAMRLVQVREFLGGHGWFDLHVARLQPPLGYDPHWSRLIDAGLAGLFIVFHHFTDAAFAERLMRAVWPLLWLLPAIGGAAAIAWRMAGRGAALMVLLFAVSGLPAMLQFKPGRIDHHNVQTAIAVLAVAATAWSDRVRWTATAAGILTGLGLAIGFECMPFLVLCAAAFALRAIRDRDGFGSLRGYGLSLAASTIAAFLVDVGPDHWARTACDSIAINSAAAAVVGGLGLALISYRRDPRTLMRCAMIAGVVAAAALVFVLCEPRCLGGPFAMADPAAMRLWLPIVPEMQPLFSVLQTDPASGLWLSMFPAAAVIAVIVLGLGDGLRRDFGFLFASAALALAVAILSAAIKGYVYAMWLAMPLVAVLALRLFAVLPQKSLAPRLLAALLLTPMALSAGAIAIAEAAGLNRPDPAGGLEPVCFETQSYAPLAKLPPGLVATSIIYGPQVLALTPHSVLAAPYHRLSAGNVAAHKIFAEPPDAAYRIVAELRVNYLATCGSLPPVGLTDRQRTASLWGRLQAGAIPDWLEREPAADGQAFAIYRVKP